MDPNIVKALEILLRANPSLRTGPVQPSNEPYWNWDQASRSYKWVSNGSMVLGSGKFVGGPNANYNPFPTPAPIQPQQQTITPPATSQQSTQAPQVPKIPQLSQLPQNTIPTFNRPMIGNSYFSGTMNNSTPQRFPQTQQRIPSQTTSSNKGFAPMKISNVY